MAAAATTTATSTATTYHKVSIADVMFDKPTAQYNDSAVLSVDCLRIDLTQICYNKQQPHLTR